MKVQCITNKTKNIPFEVLQHFTTSDSQIFLEIGKRYVVYAISTYYQHIWYCICDESYTSYPMWIPQNFFELTDKRLSRYWVFSIREENDLSKFFLGFPEWADDPYFYGELVDGDPSTIQIFRTYKKRMDMEFPDPMITENAEPLDEEWVLCRKCIDAWQSTNVLDALIECPKCHTIYNNPRYKERK